MAERGLRRARREEIAIDGRPALLLAGEQAGAPVLLLAAQSGEVTAFVTARPDPAGGAEAVAAMRAALLSLAFRAPPSLEERIDALPFRLTERAGFRPVLTQAGGSLILTRGEADPRSDPAQPLLIVATSMGGAPAAADRETHARRVFGTVPGVHSLAIREARRVTRDGAPWFDLTGQGVRPELTSGPVLVYQAIRFAPDGYVRVVLVAPAAGSAAVLAEAQRVLEGLRVP